MCEVNVDSATVLSVAPHVTCSWEGHSDDEKLVSLRSLNIAPECVSALCGPESRAPDMVHAKPAALTVRPGCFVAMGTLLLAWGAS